MDEQINNHLSNYYKLDDIIPGKVIKIKADGIWVNINLEELIFVDNKHISYLKQDSIKEIVNVGEIREFIVIKQYEFNCNYKLILSLERFQSDRIHQRIKQLQKENITIYTSVVPVVASVKGGAIVYVENSFQIGQEIKAKIIEANIAIPQFSLSIVALDL